MSSSTRRFRVGERVQVKDWDVQGEIRAVAGSLALVGLDGGAEETIPLERLTPIADAPEPAPDVRWNEQKRCHERFADLSRDGTFDIYECVSSEEEAQFQQPQEPVPTMAQYLPQREFRSEIEVAPYEPKIPEPWRYRRAKPEPAPKETVMDYYRVGDCPQCHETVYSDTMAYDASGHPCHPECKEPAPDPEPASAFERLLGEAAHDALQADKDREIQQQYVKSDLSFLTGFEAGARWGREQARAAREERDE